MGKSPTRKTSSPSTGEPKRLGRVEKSVERPSKEVQEEEEVESASTASLDKSPSGGARKDRKSRRMSHRSVTKSSPKSRSKSSSHKATSEKRRSTSTVTETQSGGNVDPPSEFPDTVPSVVHEEEDGPTQSELVSSLSPAKVGEAECETLRLTGKVQRSKSWPRFTGKRKSKMDEEVDEEEKETTFFSYPEGYTSEGEIDFSLNVVDSTFPNPPPRKRATFEEDWIRAMLEVDQPVEKEPPVVGVASIAALFGHPLVSKAVYHGRKKTSSEETPSESPKSGARSGGMLQPQLRKVESLLREPAPPPPSTAEQVVLDAERFPMPQPRRHRAVRPTGALATITSGKKLPTSLMESEKERYLTPAKAKQRSYGENRIATPYPASKIAHRARQLMAIPDDEEAEPKSSDDPPPPTSSPDQ